jgi:uncharacterized membrane protein YphA (DoxX/SURF4 family)
MDLIKYIGLIFLAVWLILQGLTGYFEFYVPYEEKIFPAINLIAGLILLFRSIKLKHGDVGLFLLGCWAVLDSVLFLFHYSFRYSNTIVHLLGLVAGILLIFRR